MNAWLNWVSSWITVAVLTTATASAALAVPQSSDPILAQARSGDAAQLGHAIEAIRLELQSNPQHAADRLNEDWLVALLQAKRYAEVKEFAVTGTIAVAADTWRIEQLQKHRVRALLAEGKPAEALSGAKALFNVSGMHFTPEALALLAECLKAAHRADPGIVARFKIQELEGAQTDPAERAKGLSATGEPVLAKVPVDPKPYAEAIGRLRGASDYRSLYALGNLLLLSGEVKEAREVFEHAYKIAPATELESAS